VNQDTTAPQVTKVTKNPAEAGVDKKVETEVQKPAVGLKEKLKMDDRYMKDQPEHGNIKKVPAHVATDEGQNVKLHKHDDDSDHSKKSHHTDKKHVDVETTKHTTAKDSHKVHTADHYKQRVIEVSAEQDSQRLREAKELRNHLQKILMEEDAPATEILSSALQRAEDLSSQIADHPELDQETRKTLEDISELLLAAQKLGRNKGIAERLQRISEESAKALEASKQKDVSTATREKTRKILDYIQEWRPVFMLLMRSKDFRQLIMDTIRIARRVVYSYGDDFQESKEKFAEGASAKELTDHVKNKAQQKEVPEMTDEEWDLLYQDIQEVLVTMAREPSYRDGMDRLFSLLDMFEKSIDTKDPANVLPKEEHLRNAISETEELIASFAGRETLDRFKKHLRNLVIEIQKNENLRTYLHEIQSFILTSKSEEEIRSDEFQSRAKKTRLSRKGCNERNPKP
jgi:hypothetical protein